MLHCVTPCVTPCPHWAVVTVSPTGRAVPAVLSARFTGQHSILTATVPRAAFTGTGHSVKPAKLTAFNDREWVWVWVLWVFVVSVASSWSEVSLRKLNGTRCVERPSRLQFGPVLERTVIETPYSCVQCVSVCSYYWDLRFVLQCCPAAEASHLSCM